MLVVHREPICETDMRPIVCNTQIFAYFMLLKAYTEFVHINKPTLPALYDKGLINMPQDMRALCKRESYIKGFYSTFDLRISSCRIMHQYQTTFFSTEILLIPNLYNALFT